MKRISDEDLIGYLLDALEPHEVLQIDSALETDYELQSRLEELRQQISGLPERFVEIDPPQGLLDKTLNTIDIVDSTGLGRSEQNRQLSDENTNQPESEVQPNSRKQIKFSNSARSQGRELQAGNGNWSMMDMIIGAVVCFVVASILLPSIVNSRFQSNVLHCQNNLRQIGQNLAHVAGAFNGKLPVENQAEPGQWQSSQFVQSMIESGLVSDLEPLICPSDPGKEVTAEICRDAWSQDMYVTFRSDMAGVPHNVIKPVLTDSIVSSETVAPKVDTATHPSIWSVNSHVLQAETLRRTEAASGSYGFPAPQLTEQGVCQMTVPGSSGYVLSADAACFDNPGFRSRNHGGLGQNVLLGDLSVSYICDPANSPTGDHIYTNNQGQVLPGKSPGDNLIYRGVIREDGSIRFPVLGK